jgi:hypothetical protein
MIDTDKYEGHSKGPWEIHGDRICAQDECSPVLNIGGNIATVAHKNVMPDNEGNKLLIVDAPLLLDFIVWVKNTHPHYYHKLTKAYEGAKNNR